MAATVLPQQAQGANATVATGTMPAAAVVAAPQAVGIAPSYPMASLYGKNVLFIIRLFSYIISYGFSWWFAPRCHWGDALR